MNKRNLIKKVAQKTGYPQSKIGEILRATTECIKEELLSGENVNLNSFGVFSLKEINEREVKHPQTGKVIVSRKKKLAKFKSSPDYLKMK